jgi:hypothetical protein
MILKLEFLCPESETLHSWLIDEIDVLKTTQQLMDKKVKGWSFIDNASLVEMDLANCEEPGSKISAESTNWLNDQLKHGKIFK